jgi:4-amino-4-deoxy-L-arabinose transferase-like glycosyltransferase
VISRSAAVARGARPDLLLVALVAAGIVTRAANLGASLFVDEAWVANSVLSGSLRDMFYYDNWLQTTPPLFLLLVRGVASLLGTSNTSLRVVPSAFGMLSIVLIAVVGNRVFGRTPAVVAVTLLVTSAAAYHYSIILKQYSADLFVSLLLLWLILRYAASPGGGTYAALAAGFAGAVFLSHITVFLVPGALYALLYGWWHPRAHGDDRRARWHAAGLAGFLVLVGLAVSVDFVTFIRPNTSPELTGYWFTDLPARATVAAMGKYYLTRSEHLVSLLVPDALLTEKRWAIAVGIVVVGALRLAVSAFRRESAERHFFWVSALLLMSVIGANLLRRYPYGDERTSLFLFPAMIFAFGAGLRAIRDGVLGERIGRRGRQVSQILVRGGCVAAVLAFAFVHVLHYSKAASEEDAEGAIRYLTANAAPGDSVYVHASMFEQFKFYRPRMPATEGVSYFYGNTGWRCCTRHHGSYYTDGADYSGMRQDLSSFLASGSAKTMWFLFIDRPGDWYWRNDPKFVKDALDGVRCAQDHVIRFRGVLLYACRSAA